MTGYFPDFCADCTCVEGLYFKYIRIIQIGKRQRKRSQMKKRKGDQEDMTYWKLLNRQVLAEYFLSYLAILFYMRGTLLQKTHQYV